MLHTSNEYLCSFSKCLFTNRLIYKIILAQSTMETTEIETIMPTIHVSLILSFHMKYKKCVICKPTSIVEQV